MPKFHTAGTTVWHTCAKCLNDILPGQLYRREGKNKYHKQPTCSRAKSRHAYRPVPLPDESVFRPRNPTRLLKCYGGRAKVTHECFECAGDISARRQMLAEILPGDRYTAEVWLVRDHVEIRYFHDGCPIDPYDEDLEKMEEEWDDIEQHDFGEEPLPLAA